MSFDQQLISQALTVPNPIDSRPPRHCKKCEQDKPAAEFPTVNGEICTECKTEKRRAKEARKNRCSTSRYPALHAWREAWPHLKTQQ